MITTVYGNPVFLHTFMSIKNYLIMILVMIIILLIIVLRIRYYRSKMHDNKHTINKLNVNMVKRIIMALVICSMPSSVLMSSAYGDIEVFNHNIIQRNTSTTFARQMTSKRQATDEELLEGKQTGSFTTRMANLDCYFNVPTELKKNTPLVIFLHGISEHNINRVMTLKPVTAITDGTLEGQEDFIFVAPSAPNHGNWLGSASWDMVIELIDEISKEYMIDVDRVYLTGFSAGANAVWGILNKYPDRFRAAVAVSGHNNITPSNLVNIPIYAMVGGYESGRKLTIKKLADSVNAAGGNVIFDVIPKANHSLTQYSYTTNELYNWLLSK